MRINFNLRWNEPVHDPDAIVRFRYGKERSFVLLRKSTLLTVCVLISVTSSRRADAQWTERAGVSNASARHGRIDYANAGYLSREVAGAVGVDSAGGTPRGAIGAVIGAALGSLLGYRWEMGLCENAAGQCTGKHGAIGGAVVGAVVGFVLDWAISGLREPEGPKKATP